MAKRKSARRKPKQVVRKTAWATLNQKVVACEKCPRLIEHCQAIAETKRRAYIDDDYWWRPPRLCQQLPPC
ncbi:MAG: hypothetical protein H8E37_07150 [Planctomycetes bacterium]|nr:hypothetical protein [Planctomycetota bacterium]